MFRIPRLRRRVLAYGATGIGVAVLVVSATLYDAGLATPHAVGEHQLHSTADGLAPGSDQQGSIKPVVVAKAHETRAHETKAAPRRHGNADMLSSFNKPFDGGSLAGSPQANAVSGSGTTTTTSVVHPRGSTPPTTVVPTTPVPSCAPQNQYAGTSLTGFIAAGEANHGATECLSSWGESLTATANIHIYTSAALNFEGARVTGAASLSGAMLSIGAPSSITQVTLDQGSGSGNGIDCNAACSVTSTTVEGMRGDGIFVSGGNADGSTIGGTSAASGVTTEGTLQSGLMFNAVSDVTVGYYHSNDDNHNGALFNQVSAPCSATSITATDLGQPSSTWNLPTNDGGGGLNLIGTHGCEFQSVTDSGNGGYGVAVSSSSDNTFGYVSVIGEAQGELNSGINVATGSADNNFETASINHEATGVDIGDDGVTGGAGETGNDGNAFGTLNLSNDTYGSVSITGGMDNTFTRITGTSEGNDADGRGFYVGLIQFQQSSAPVSGNVVRSASFTGSNDLGRWDTARYVVYGDAGASGNVVSLSAQPSTATYTDSACGADGDNHFYGC